VGAIRTNDFARNADGCGQAGGDHPSSRTDPDDAERLTGIYGSVPVGRWREAAAEPLPVLGPEGPAVRVGLPPETSQAPPTACPWRARSDGDQR
jgi:hypothetical protein